MFAPNHYKKLCPPHGQRSLELTSSVYQTKWFNVEESLREKFFGKTIAVPIY